MLPFGTWQQFFCPHSSSELPPTERTGTFPGSGPPAPCSLLPLPQSYVRYNHVTQQGKNLPLFIYFCKFIETIPSDEIPWGIVWTTALFKWLRKMLHLKYILRSFTLLWCHQNIWGSWPWIHQFILVEKEKITHKFTFLSFFKCIYFLTLPSQWFLDN